MIAWLALTVVFFAAVHLVPAVPALKARLAAACGSSWNLVYGLAATAGVVAIIAAYAASPFVAVYDPPPWGRTATIVLMAIAFALLGIFLFRGRARLALRFPLALAVIVWGIAHLLANGDLASLILFGGLASYGLAHFVLGWASGQRPQGPAREGHDLLGPMAGLALYGLMVQLHGVLIGVPVFTPH